MLGANEALSRVKIDVQLKDRGIDVLEINAVRIERCRSVLGIVAQQSKAMRKVQAVLQSLFARPFNSYQVTEGATEEVAVA